MKMFMLLLFVTSCSSYVRTQATKMLSPESQGGLGNGQVELRFEAQKKDHLDFADDTTENAIDRADTTYAFAPVGEVGIFDSMDFYIQPHTQIPSIIGIKFQLIGKGKEETGKGSFSTSLLLGYGNNSKETSPSGDLEEVFSENIEDIKIDAQHEEVGLIFGYRWFEKLLHYVNIIYQSEQLKGKVTNVSGTLTNASFKYNNDGMIYSSGFIHYFGTSGHWKFDYSYATSDWSKTQLQTVNSISTAIGFGW